MLVQGSNRSVSTAQQNDDATLVPPACQERHELFRRTNAGVVYSNEKKNLLSRSVVGQTSVPNVQVDDRMAKGAEACNQMAAGTASADGRGAEAGRKAQNLLG
jgi:hypothetical protein